MRSQVAGQYSMIVLCVNEISVGEAGLEPAFRGVAWALCAGNLDSVTYSWPTTFLRSSGL